MGFANFEAFESQHLNSFILVKSSLLAYSKVVSSSNDYFPELVKTKRHILFVANNVEFSKTKNLDALH